jgi:hypothetical protein
MSIQIKRAFRNLVTYAAEHLVQHKTGRVVTVRVGEGRDQNQAHEKDDKRRRDCPEEQRPTFGRMSLNTLIGRCQHIADCGLRI